MNNTTAINPNNNPSGLSDVLDAITLSDLFDAEDEKVIRELLDRKHRAKTEDQQKEMNTVIFRYINTRNVYQKISAKGLTVKYIYDLIILYYENQTR